MSSQDNVLIDQGETLKFIIPVYQPGGQPMNLLGAQAKIAYVVDNQDYIEDCQIQDNVVTAVIDSSKTMHLEGNYPYQIVLFLANQEVKSLAKGFISIDSSYIEKIFNQQGE